MFGQELLRGVMASKKIATQTIFGIGMLRKRMFGEVFGGRLLGKRCSAKRCSGRGDPGSDIRRKGVPERPVLKKAVME